MKINAIRKEFYDMCSFETELMNNEENPILRPCLIVVKLKYKGTKQDFAIPLRSNISKTTPRHQYFKLPKTNKTRSGNKSGLHYTKMFPIHKMFLLKYNTDRESFEKTMIRIDNNELEIIRSAQKYLDDYENGLRENFCVDIERIYNALNRCMTELSEVSSEVAVYKTEE